MITFTRCAFMAKQACATCSKVVQKITPPIANNFLKFFFALFATLTLNAATAWAETWSHTFTSTESAGSKNWDNINWVLTINGGTTSSYDSDKGAHYGTNNNTCTSVSFTTSGIKGTISSIKIEASRGSSLVGKLSISVGDQEYTLSNNATSHALTTTNTAYDFQGNNSGNIAISWKKTSGKGAFYIKSITVTYEEVASCDKKVILTKGSETNGTFTLDKANGSYDNCDEDFVVKVSNVVPTSSSQYCSGVNVTGGNSTVTGPIDGVWTVTYAKENNITSTITPTFADKIFAVITLSEAGATSSVSGKYVGDSYTLPSTSSQACGDKKFVGWSTEIIENSPTKPTAATYFEPGASVTLGATNKFYAVFAEGDGSEILTSITGGDWSTTGADGDWSTSGTGTYSGNGVKFDDANDYVTSPDMSSKGYTRLLLKFKSGHNGGQGSVLTFYAYNKNATLLTEDDVTIDPKTVVPTDAYTTQNTIYQVSISANEVIGKIMIIMTSKTKNLGMKYCEIFGVSSSYQNYTTKCAETYTITVANNISNGSVSADKSSAVEGATIKLTATPNTGYKLGTWNVKDASNNSVSVNASGEFTMPASNVTVSATFVSLPKLATPSELSATEINPTSAKLSWEWSENTYAAQLSYYYLYIKKEGDANFTGPITYTSTSCSRTNLEPNTNYIWKVQAISKDKTIVLTSEESAESSFTTAALPTYTVSFSTGTGNPTQADITETEGGQGITLPAGPDPLCPDWTFAGWATSSVAKTTTEPTLLKANDKYQPTSNITLHAVYSKTEENGGGTDYQLVTSEPTDWSGTYLIVNTEDAKVWKGSATSDNGAIDVTITSNTIKSDETTDKEIFTIAPMTGGYSIKGASGKYISGTSGDNKTNYGTSAALNTISIDEDNNVKITSNTSVLRQNNTSKNLFRYYKSSSYSTQHPIQLYKKGTGSSITTFSSNPDCTPPAEYTITWWANGEEFYTQKAVEGTAIEIPTTSPNAATYACEDKVFVGWVESEIDEATDEEPIYTTDFDKITGDRDFYAVFATEENNDESIFAVGKSGDFKIYALVEEANIYATAYDNGKLGSTSDENSAVIYTFTHKGENQYTIYNGSKYIAYGTSGTDLKTQSDEYLWKIAPATNGKGSWRITSVSTTNRAIIYRTGYDFKAYGTTNITSSGYYDIEIGSVPTTTYSGYVTTCEKPTYTRDVTPSEYGTMCLPYASSNYSGAEFYEVSSLVQGQGLWLDQLADGAQLEAGKPYIFYATDSEITVTYTGDAKAAPVAGKNGLTGTFTDIAAGGVQGHYIIAQNKIWQANDKNTLPANRAYIKNTVPTTPQAQIPGRRRVCMGENTTTGLDNSQFPITNIQKVIENGQLIIIRNGEKLNAQGIKL